MAIHLVAADARFEIEIRYIHFLETKRAFGVFLQSTMTGAISQETTRGAKCVPPRRRSNTRPEHQPGHEIWIGRLKRLNAQQGQAVSGGVVW